MIENGILRKSPDQFLDQSSCLTGIASGSEGCRRSRNGIASTRNGQPGESLLACLGIIAEVRFVLRVTSDKGGRVFVEALLPGLLDCLAVDSSRFCQLAGKRGGLCQARERERV